MGQKINHRSVIYPHPRLKHLIRCHGIRRTHQKYPTKRYLLQPLSTLLMLASITLQIYSLVVVVDINKHKSTFPKINSSRVSTSIGRTITNRIQLNEKSTKLYQYQPRNQTNIT